jgi:cation diffusion facilitator family transporter
VTSTPDRSGGSLRTVVTAVVANVLVALAKGGAALVTGSPALLAETLHSVADAGNEALLLVGLSRSRRPVDPQHPFGYGQERYFWAFLAALGIFLIGGILSIGEGIRSLLQPDPLTSPVAGISVLVASAIFESYSWIVARRQLRDTAARVRGRSIVQHLNRASDPSAPTVFLEDSAALIGIALALIALLLHLVTGHHAWDAAGSICIGVLLIVVAFLLARRSKSLLIDEAAPPDIVAPIRAALVRPAWVVDVTRLDVIFIGPARLLVLARIEVIAELLAASAAELHGHVDQLRQELLRTPAIAEVAIGVDTARPDSGGR